MQDNFGYRKFNFGRRWLPCAAKGLLFNDKFRGGHGSTLVALGSPEQWERSTEARKAVHERLKGATAAQYSVD